MGEGNANIEVSSHLREHGSAVARAARGRDPRDPRGDPARRGGRRHRAQRLPGGQVRRHQRQGLCDGVALPGAVRADLAHQQPGDHLQLGHAERLAAGRGRQQHEARLTAGAAVHAELRGRLQDLAEDRPAHQPQGAAGPRYIPQYRDPLVAQANRLSAKSTAAYNDGVESRDHADNYVRLTVILAAVLFLIAIGQRFRIRGVRLAVLGIAGALIVYCDGPAGHLSQGMKKEAVMAEGPRRSRTRRRASRERGSASSATPTATSNRP